MSDEPIDTFSPEERDRLCSNLDALHQEVERGGFSGRSIDRALAEEINRRLWAGIRNYGGRVRRRGEGPEVLIILGHRSPVRDDVPRLLDELLARVARHCRDLGDGAAAVDIIGVAATAHVELIRLQPFTDGNKRTARLLLSIILVRLGLNAVNFGVPRQDYVSALAAGFGGEMGPMTDLVIDLLAAQVRT